MELDVFQGSCIIFKYKFLIKHDWQWYQLISFYGKKAGISNKSNEKYFFFLFWIDKSAPRKQAWGQEEGQINLTEYLLYQKNAWSTLLTFFAFFCTAYLQTRTRKFREFGWLTQGEHQVEVADLGHEVGIYTLS